MSTTLAEHSPRQAPAIPGGKRILGHVAFLDDDPLTMFQKARDEVGDIARMRLAHKPAFVVQSPEAIEKILVTSAENYVKTTRGYDKLALVLGRGLVTSEGEFWLRQRRIAQPAFRRKCLEGFGQIMEEGTTEIRKKWAAAAQQGGEVEAYDEMMSFALNVAGKTLFSADVSDLKDVIGPALEVVLHHFNRLVAAPVPYPEYWPIPQNLVFWRSNKTLHRLVDDLIAERRKGKHAPHDLLSMFMMATDPETGGAMTDRQLRDEMLTALLAGHETTANALTWTFYLLAEHPQIADRLAAELDAAADGQAPLTFQQAQKVPFLKQVIQESLRLYPPVWLIARVPLEPDVLGGFEIPKGAFVFVPTHSVHRHPRLWDRPDVFDPDRFGPDRKAPSRYAYMPFIRGRRQCIGDRFAMMEMTTCLAQLARDFRFERPDDQVVEPQPYLTLRPKYGMRLRVTERHASNRS